VRDLRCRMWQQPLVSEPLRCTVTLLIAQRCSRSWSCSFGSNSGRSLASHEVKGRPTETLKAQARAYRRFATQHPNGYALMLDVRAANTDRGVRARAEALTSALSALATLVGQSQALVAARVLTPFLHGFVSMENSAAFRLGPGLDAAFEHGIDTILRGLINATPPKPARGSRGR